MPPSPSLDPPQQNLYQQQQKHEHGQPSPPSANLLSNYNSMKNSAPSAAASTSQSNRSPAHPSSSSALASPAPRSFSTNQSSNGSTGPDQSGSDSSDVEIYLNTLVPHDSVSHMHDSSTDAISNNSTNPQPQARSQVTNELSVSSGLHLSARDHQQQKAVGGDSASPGPTSQAAGTNHKFGLGVSDSRNPNDTKSANLNTGSTLSPLPLSLPLSSSPSQLRSHSQRNGNGQQHIPQAKSPQNPPPAPVHATIPLPEIDECEYSSNERVPYIERRQFQQQYQPLHGHGHGNVQERGYGFVQGHTIDLAGLNISSPSQKQALGMSSPPSQTQPLSSPSDFGITPSSTTSSGFDVSSSTSTAATTPALGSAASVFCASDSNPNPVADDGLSLLDSNRTPNVYINGLPPHFPEDQLFALASPFGEIRSVRTFTRHVRDSESGYGFVLFETIDAAERCIISLRRYRNLHPTFSKQIHKIPGTTYAQANLESSGSSTPSWDEQGEISGGAVGPGSTASNASFKAKMESLHDPTSTNLYMEGLPLSIDESTLSALVSPHRISSSRFFQTRLSHPPRIIAFVRLETRVGAEEVIERLHGRMVRGWNDTGSRISVRFADTSEQRELRLKHQRSERSTDEGEGSPARMTIAQAALLNLRGQELRPPKAGPVIHAQAGGVRDARAAARGLGKSASIPDFSSNAPLNISSGVGDGGRSTGLDVDYSLAPGRNLSAGGGMGHGRGPSPGIHPYQTQPSSNWSAHGVNQGHRHGQPSMDPTMVALLDSLRGNGVPYKAGDSDYMQNHRSAGIGHHPHPSTQAHSLQHHNHLGASRSLGDISYSRPVPAYTRSGYTATEEYIMRAHADSAALAQAQAQAQYQQQQQQQAAERRRPTPLDLRRRQWGDEGQDESSAANIAVGLRGYRTQASIGRVGQEIISPPTTSSSSQSMMGGLSSTMNEEDFHASAAAVRNEFRQQLLAGNGGGDRDGGGGRMAQESSTTGHNLHIHPAHVNARLSRESSGQYQQQQSSQQPPQQQVQRPLALSPLLASSSNIESPNPNDPVNYQHAPTHIRSTTLPQHRSSSVRDSQQQQLPRARGHYQHSSMSIPAQTLKTPQHASVSVMNGNSGVDGGGVIYEGGHQQSQQQQPFSQGATNQQNANHSSMDTGTAWTSNNGHSQPSLHSHGTKPHYSSPNIYSDDPSSSSPSLISPTLTYSGQTPSTLSPATPFFGSFNNQAEGFEKGSGAGHGVNVHVLDQQQKTGASATRSGSR
ncbi:hypothetical protein BYT27DRAFT_7217680 [Phlegmacium glaucopus]|nr:hypothetical protein BYT27DRAFT_7217680 [Phlegmacium glaucopus]